jgi:hypothetical protein
MDRLLMQTGFEAVKPNRGAAGVDQVGPRMSAATADNNRRAREREFKDGSFDP